ncbi:stress-inducible protein [Tanacetum coccineum]
MMICQYDECIKDCDKSMKRGRELHFDYKMVAGALTRKGTASIKMTKVSKDFEPSLNLYGDSSSSDPFAAKSGSVLMAGHLSCSLLRLIKTMAYSQGGKDVIACGSRNLAFQELLKRKG